MLTFLMDTQSTKNYNRGVQQIRKFLKTIPSISNFQLKDTSGLSRENKFTAQDFALVLEFMKNQPYFPEFLSSLPIAGEDGTLENHKIFKRSKSSSFIRAKTGSLNEVTGLAGYILLPECNDSLTISFLYNGPREEKAKIVLDKIAMHLKSQSCQIFQKRNL